MTVMMLRRARCGLGAAKAMCKRGRRDRMLLGLWNCLSKGPLAVQAMACIGT